MSGFNETEANLNRKIRRLQDFHRDPHSMFCLSCLILSIFICSACATTYSLEKGKQLYEGKKYDLALKQFEYLYLNSSDYQELAWQYIIKTKKMLRKDRKAPSLSRIAPAQKVDFICRDSQETESEDTVGKSVSFLGTELREALIELSILHDFPIVSDQSVDGLISAEIKNLTLRESLEMMLFPENYSFKKFKNFLPF